MTTTQVLGAVAVIIGLVGYVPYFRDIFRGKTKPHAFSWLVWGALTAIAFFGQLSGKGGAGTWVTGVTALVCLAIFGLALAKGKHDFPLADWLCLAGAGLSLVLWAVTKSPLTSVILITIIDAIGFVPTFVKSYKEPHAETLFTFSLSSLKFAVGLVALQNYSLVTVLYPASLVMTNLAFVAMSVLRRKQLQDNSTSTNSALPS